MGAPIHDEHFSEPDPEDEPMDVVDPPPQVTQLPQKRPHFLSHFLRPPFGQQGSTTPPAAKQQAKKARGQKKKGKVPSPEHQPASEIERMCRPRGGLPPLRFIPHLNLEITPSFFNVLLAVDPLQSDLLDMHIDCWVALMRMHRGTDTRWNIMFSMFFHYLLIEHIGVASVVRECNGQEGTSWALLDRVYIPICLNPVHWVLGVFELDAMTLTIYDSDSASIFKNQLEEQMTRFKAVLFDLFCQVKDDRRRDRVDAFRYRFSKRAPQQAGMNADCGVWVCRNVQMLMSNNEVWVHPNETEAVAKDFRRLMAESIYEHCQIGPR